MKLNDSITYKELKEFAKTTIINSLCYSAGFIISLFDKKEKENKK